MKIDRMIVAIGTLAMLGSSCEDQITTLAPEKLAPPLGLKSVTGDGSVRLSWQASNYGEGRQGFRVYQASGDQTTQAAPEMIPAAFGTTHVVELLNSSQSAGTFQANVTGLTNGTTYSFLVVAFKDDGGEVSRPSNIVKDTPRRESPATIELINGDGNPRFLDVAGNPPAASTIDAGADILCRSFNAGAGDRHGIEGRNGARVQDLGFVSSWDEIDKAPTGLGSYPDADFSVQVLEGHVYAVFTGDNHYAKIYIVSINGNNFGYVCRVAFQPQTGNNELKPGAPAR
jgi:hypothetical protein